MLFHEQTSESQSSKYDMWVALSVTGEQLPGFLKQLPCQVSSLSILDTLADNLKL